MGEFELYNHWGPVDVNQERSRAEVESLIFTRATPLHAPTVPTDKKPAKSSRTTAAEGKKHSPRGQATRPAGHGLQSSMHVGEQSRNSTTPQPAGAGAGADAGAGVGVAEEKVGGSGLVGGDRRATVEAEQGVDGKGKLTH